ncbi:MULTISPECIES: sucrose-specific PTS transporter subunit IIBC [Alkalihalophilus]|jgi:PTS system sucrose-specific IIC component|uniref:Phosphotransferase system (PTS) sucrose-specific enzyme IIBC component n=4 Tax=Bacillaceae TaxID=186817 RepID=D3FPW6_ALKPO|nr:MULTISPECIES: sucrose-specific PTS transporter subunit IIBC [Alkalihalophilus]ADC49526.1 Phosphotransferase system (PTS) sucrose-specific enzyme IIBC component [Alkalihalophilus pseudofirmus OF4]ERN51685.1 PTS sugar transporter [Alkalihalophilus marmarensis DSM 21297]MCM3491635.1 sucrose-specific PTS transporter subunit IIBC [Alkalihalophilus marmarensis]MDV2886972.1 sucrose-specific PTS transporter subunit IIBC [Alkalihalophilus pseudofirmus]MEC2072853.1 sucrose-specific PTS transporter su
MDTKKVAHELVDLLGGADNVVSATHCATRLRIVLNDDDKPDKSQIEELDGVKGVFKASGQYQVIFGTGLVNKVYAEFAELTGLGTKDTDGGEKQVDHADAAKKKMNPLARIARTLSNIFVPIIPAIVASGLLMGLLGMLQAFELVPPDSPWILFLDMFSSAAFIILPILIGFSAAKEFGANPYLGAVLGGIMTHPALLNPWTLADAEPETIQFLGMNVDLLGYQGTVIPILLVVYIMSKIERGVRKVVPNAIDLLVTPFVTVIVTGFIAMLFVGPLGTMIGNGLTWGLDYIYNTAGIFAGLLFGGLYSTIVITGVHHSFHAIEAALIADFGMNFLLPIWAMANVAQGGAGLAVFFLTKNPKVKEIAIPASFSAFLGITEPVIFGVNLRFMRPFIGAAIGGALGGAYVVFTNVVTNAYGLTGIPMFAIAAPFGTANIINYAIGILIAAGGAFVATLLLGLKEDAEKKK